MAGETTVLAISHQPELVEMAGIAYRFGDGTVHAAVVPVGLRGAAGR